MTVRCVSTPWLLLAAVLAGAAAYALRERPAEPVAASAATPILVGQAAGGASLTGQINVSPNASLAPITIAPPGAAKPGPTPEARGATSSRGGHDNGVRLCYPTADDNRAARCQLPLDNIT